MLSFGTSTRPRMMSSQPVTPSSGIRKRIAPSSSYAFPRRRAAGQAAGRPPVELEAHRAVPVDAEPGERSLDLLGRLCTSRLVSVFSIRRSTSPPFGRANSQLKRKVRTLPIWRSPVGLGAMRTRTGGFTSLS